MVPVAANTLPKPMGKLLTILKALLLLVLAVALALGATYVYLSQTRDLRGAVRDDWEPPAAAAPVMAPAEREPCAERAPQRRAYFGDLHVHTALSYDAYGYGTPALPDDAYRFATGAAVALAATPGGEARSQRIDRPLDFAAVTDHAEWMADAIICADPRQPVYDNWFCRGFRGEGRFNRLRYFVAARMSVGRPAALCGEDGSRCRAATRAAWEETQAAAERWYDRSADCRFTTFHAYEYSRRDRGFMLHRNVVFRNERVPELPISWVETTLLQELWQGLAEQCNDAPGHCEALAIPHNMNLSAGMAFRLPYKSAGEQVRARYAALRRRFEPIVEMMQAKGESECRNGLSGVLGEPDELCAFEKMLPPAGEKAPPACDEDALPAAFDTCVGPLGYARYGLAEGLAERDAVGINPLEFGFIGSTDTHNGTPGAVQEAAYEGHTGRATSTPARRLEQVGPKGKSLNRNPGGLAGVWAEDNSRDALFDALQRRETFGTSGPRIEPRFFAAPDYPADLCEREDVIAAAYAGGVPMGGTLDAPPQSPHFLVQARRDPGTQDYPGTDLQRLQVVKVWSEGEGRYGQAVFDVSGAPHAEPALDTATCQPLQRGAAELCATWRDPDYDPDQAAAYYVRALEMPSCRWSQRQCLAFKEDERPPACADPAVPKAIRERAWTSPIWVLPED